MKTLFMAVVFIVSVSSAWPLQPLSDNAFGLEKYSCGDYELSGRLRIDDKGNRSIFIHPDTTAEYGIIIRGMPVKLAIGFDKALIRMKVRITKEGRSSAAGGEYIKKQKPIRITEKQLRTGKNIRLIRKLKCR